MISEQNKAEIYAKLTGKFKAGEKYPLSAVGKYLSTQGFNARRFGYTQMKKLMQDIPDLVEIVNTDNEGHPNCDVLIREWSAPDNPNTGASENSEQSSLSSSEADDKKENRKKREKQNSVNDNHSAEKVSPDSGKASSKQDNSEVKDSAENISSRRNAGRKKSSEKTETSTADSLKIKGARNMAPQQEDGEGISLTVFQKSNFSSFTSGTRNYNNFSRNYGNNHQDESFAEPRDSSGCRFTGESGDSVFKADNASKMKETRPAARENERRTTENKEEGSTFERLAYLSVKVLDFLNRKGMEDPASSLNEAYLKSIREKTYQQRGDVITFPFVCGEEDMVAVLKRNEKTYGKPWYLSYVGYPSADPEPTDSEEKEEAEENKVLSPGHALEDFADIGFWQEFLKELADTALPEAWDFKGSRENGRYYILKKYIQYTFYRLKQENKICISKGNFAAFNTGLVNSRYQDIFACFVPNPAHDTNETLPAWKFEAFAIAGQRGKDGYGKLITSYFNPLPELPRYYDSISDLFFDLNAPLVTDYEHIIIDNIDRLPLEYLKECCFSDEEAQMLLAQLEASVTREKKKQAYYQLSHYIVENDRIYRRMKARMEDAIEISLKRVRWNFRTAVPCYFPKGNCMSLMLPLALADDGYTDAALVVLKNPSGSYQGQTILEIEKAYLDARLVCRPNNDWMSIEAIGYSASTFNRNSRTSDRSGGDYVSGERTENLKNDMPGAREERRTAPISRGDFYARAESASPVRGETYRSDYGRTVNGSQPRYNSYGNRSSYGQNGKSSRISQGSENTGKRWSDRGRDQES